MSAKKPAAKETKPKEAKPAKEKAPAKEAAKAPAKDAKAPAKKEAKAPAKEAKAPAAPKAKAPTKAKVAKGKAAAKTVKFSIDCSQPVEDDIFDIAAFEKFLHERVKVNGKSGALGESIKITREGSSINIAASIHMAKRTLKYLTKKFLKKQMLRDYIRVIARTKNGYFLRYFTFQNEENAGEE